MTQTMPTNREETFALFDRWADDRSARIAALADAVDSIGRDDRPESADDRIARRVTDTFRPRSIAWRPAADRLARGTDVLWGEQADEYAALRTDLMARGLTDPIGPRFSRAATDHTRRARRFGRRFAAEYAAADTARAFHALAYPDAYALEARTDHAADRPYAASIVPRHPRIADRLPSALLPEMEPNGHGLTRADRIAWTLEAAADEILRAAGDDVVRTDHRDARTRQMTVNPDRVAYRGTPVHTLAASADETRAVSTRGHRVKVRYSRTGNTVATSYRCHVRPTDPDAAWADAMIGRVTFGRVSELETIQLRGTRSQWSVIGHRRAVRVEDSRTRRARKLRERTAAERPATAGKRGPARDPFAITARNLRNRWSKATDDQVAAADRIVAILTTTTPDHPIPTTRGPIIRTDAATVRPVDGETFTLIEYARRAALAGVVIE